MHQTFKKKKKIFLINKNLPLNGLKIKKLHHTSHFILYDVNSE